MKIGNIDISDVKIGSNDVSKVYRGSDLMWERITTKSLFINSTYIESDLTDYPVVIKQNNFNTNDFTKNVDNLRFYDENDNILNHEIVNFSEADTEIWVKVPYVSSSTNTIIKYNFSGDGVVNPLDVWDDDFCIVCHLKYIDNTNFYDSKNGLFSNNKTGLSVSSTNKWGTSIQFSEVNGSNIFFPYITKYGEANSLGRITTQMFGYRTGGSNRYIFSSGGGNAHALIFGYVGGKFEFYSRPRLVLNDESVVSNRYVNIAFSYENSNKLGVRYFNGLDVDYVGTQNMMAADTGGIYVGGVQNQLGYQGSIDEVRLSSVARSKSWVKADNFQYYNQDTFILNI